MMSGHAKAFSLLTDRSKASRQDDVAASATRKFKTASDLSVVIPRPSNTIAVPEDSDDDDNDDDDDANDAVPTVRPTTNNPVSSDENAAITSTQPKVSRFNPSLAKTSKFFSANPVKRVRSANADELAALQAPKKKKRVRLRGTTASLDLVNEVDDATLPRNFTFVDEYVFREGTKRLDPEFRTGCTCGEHNGRDIGCEYAQKCECLEDAAKALGKVIGFPYHAVGVRSGCLQTKYLNTRWAIYECNDLCNCGPRCRNKLVQHGRQIPLEIFRTKDRGWGLRSTKHIQKGQFVDTYRGEVITDAEADRRENESSSTKDSYLFTLDKFADIIDDPSALFVVDGEFMGGPTRFINHSCDPNCAIFAVSTTRGDAKVYELAFFALEDIPANEELTFDYVGDDEDKVADDDDIISSQTTKNTKLATKCLCRSDNCRGYLWL